MHTRGGGGGDPFDDSRLRHALVLLVAAKLVALVLVFDPLGLQSFDLPKSIASRALAWPLAGVLLLSFLRFGPRILPRTPLHLAVLAFLAANVLATVFAPHHYTALFGERGRYLGLTFLADMALLYLAVSVAFVRGRDWAVLAAALAVAALGAIAYALVQRLGLDPFAWTGETATFPAGTLGNPNILSHFLGVAFAAGLSVALFARQVSAPLRAASLLLAVLALGTGAIVGSRALILSVLVSLAVAALLYVRLAGPRLAKRRLALAVPVAVAVLLAVLAFTPVGERLLATAAGSGIEDRLLVWEGGLRAIQERPVLGFGPDGFSSAYPRHRTPGALLGSAHTSPHNWVVQTAVSSGLVGLAALVATLALFAAPLWRRGLRIAPGLAAPLLVVAAAYWGQALLSVGSIGVDWVPWVGLGAAAAMLGARPAPTAARPLPPVLYAIVMAAAGLAALSGVMAFEANRAALVASVAWHEQRTGEALAAARLAVERDPGRADHWNWLGLAREQQGDLAGAASAFEEAAERAPHRSEYWLNLAITRARQFQAGDRSAAAAAVSAARRAVEGDPADPLNHAIFADVANVVGERAIALEALSAGWRLHPAYGTYDRVLAAVEASWPSRSEAREAIARLLPEHDRVAVRLALARLSLDLDDPRAARQHAARALALDGDSAEAMEILTLVGPGH